MANAFSAATAPATYSGFSTSLPPAPYPGFAQTSPINNVPYLYNPTQVKDAQRIIKRNPRVEIGVNSFYQNLIETVEQGIYGYHTRGEFLNLKGFAEAERLEKDPQIKLCLRLLKLSVLQMGISVKIADIPETDPNYEKAEELQNFWKFVVGDMDCTLEDAVFDIMSAILYGYSISEKVYKWINHGKYSEKPYLGLRAIKTKRPGLYSFEYDAFDNILAIRNLVTQTSLPKEKFIYYSWMSTFSNPFGNGEFETLWSLWFLKKELTKQMGIAAARYASPTLIVKLPGHAPEAEQEEAENFIADVLSNVAGTLPEDLHAEFLEVSHRGKNPFVELINWCDSQMSRCLGNMLGSHGDSNGSFAKSKVEFSGINKVFIRYITKTVEDLLYEQLIKPVTMYNFGQEYPIETYPSIEFNPVNEEDRKIRSQIDKAYYDMGYLTNSPEHTKYIQQREKYPIVLNGSEHQNPNNTTTEPDRPEVDSDDEAMRKADEQVIG